MTPDIEQHLELLAGILAVTLAILHRLLKKRNGHVSLLLTVSDTEQPSSESHLDTRTNEADGRKTDSSAPKKPLTKQQRGDDHG